MHLIEDKDLRDCDECCHLQRKLIEFDSFDGTVRLCECCLREAISLIEAPSHP